MRTDAATVSLVPILRCGPWSFGKLCDLSGAGTAAVANELNRLTSAGVARETHDFLYDLTAAEHERRRAEDAAARECVGIGGERGREER